MIGVPCGVCVCVCEGGGGGGYPLQLVTCNFIYTQ